MKKDITIFLNHILESITLIEKYIDGVKEDQFHMSTEKQDLAVRRLEIIGEATKNLPTEFREKYPDIPWKQMAGMRDKISHQYFDIDYNIVWDTVKNMLPPLKKQIEEILRTHKG
ncbi:MAG TPA: DUF86 domain-containing protein [Xanthomonadales bacterium]|nr:DUF86 domain-containing protein [Xanthomonadales bacterium]